MSLFTDAIARLLQYNGNNYNAGTNPKGLAAGGHRTNFTPALQDVATVGDGVSALAASAAASASAAATSETNAAASASKLSGTSSTSIAIPTGAASVGPFTTQSGKSFDGVWVSVRSAANPTLNYMTGLASYSGSSLTLAVPAGGYAGSGTYSDWLISVSAKPGDMGIQGIQGLIGPVAAFKLNFSNGTGDSDPGNGIFRCSGATLALTTYLYIDNLNAASQDISAWLDALDDSTTTADRGRVRLFDPAGSAAFVDFKVNGPVVDGTGYRKVPVAVLTASVATSAAPPFTNGQSVAIQFTPTGNAGLNGTGAGDVVGPAGATDGVLALFDGATGKLLKTAPKGIGTSGSNIGALDTANTWSGIQSFPVGSTAATPTVGDNTTKIATTAFVDAAVSALIAAAPGALDTLDELAAALGDDANFASTMTTALAGKAAKASNLSDLTAKYTAKDNISVHGADIASASTLNLEAATGDVVDVTGTTTINAITLADGHERTVRFLGATTLVHSTILLPGGANIVTASGDFAVFRGYAGGFVCCVSYQKANGAPIKTRSKIVSVSRNMAAASGQVSYTGVGFKPTSLTVIAAIDFTADSSIGFSDQSLVSSSRARFDGQEFTTTSLVRIIKTGSSGANAQSCSVVSYDDDGFTWDWTKAGSPASETMVVSVLCTQ